MSATDVDVLLQQGITAVKRGDKENGRQLLLQLLDIDDQNEQAWLWLSGAVEDKEERLICLENVLTINPENELAQKGMARFGADGSTQQKKGKRILIEQEKVALSPAAAILYPERQVTQLEWNDPTADLQPTEQVGFVAETQYDDIWSQNVDICGYCAYEVGLDDRRCPRCNHHLIVKQYQYARESSSLASYWVLLFAISQFLDMVILQSYALAFFNVVMVGLFFGLAVGIYFRQYWAFISSLVLLIAVIMAGLLVLLVPVDLSALNLAQYDISIARYVGGVTSGFHLAVRMVRLFTAVLALLFAIFKVSSDFEHTRKRQLAVLTRGLKTGTDYHMAARQLAQAGLWATAVLHWQRASALEAHRTIYQRDLGRAYAHLGFTQRATDVLQSALARSKNEILRAEIQETLALLPEMDA